MSEHLTYRITSPEGSPKPGATFIRCICGWHARYATPRGAKRARTNHLGAR